MTSVEDLPDTLRNRSAKIDQSQIITKLSLVDARVSSGFIGHSYFYSHPAASSDLVMILRDDLDPGPGGRPLQNLGSIFWRLGNDYPPKGSYVPREARAD